MIKWKTHQKNTASTCWIYQSAVPEVFVPINGPVVPLFRHFEHLFPCRRLRLLLCGLSTSGADPRLPCPSLLRRCHTSGSAAGLEQQQQHQLSADRQGRERELKSVAVDVRKECNNIQMDHYVFVLFDCCKGGCSDAVFCPFFAASPSTENQSDVDL